MRYEVKRCADHGSRTCTECERQDQYLAELDTCPECGLTDGDHDAHFCSRSRRREGTSTIHAHAVAHSGEEVSFDVEISSLANRDYEERRVRQNHWDRTGETLEFGHNQEPKAGDRSPWGRIDEASQPRVQLDRPEGSTLGTWQHADGVRFVSTPSHGGFWVAAERLTEIPIRWREFAAKWSRGFGPQWFEEDAAAVVVAALLLKEPRAMAYLQSMEQRYFPEVTA
jgi:hypothetical protein